MFKRVRIDISNEIGQNDRSDQDREWIDIRPIMYLPSEKAAKYGVRAQGIDDNNLEAITGFVHEIATDVILDWHLEDEDGQWLRTPADLKRSNDNSFEATIRKFPTVVLMAIADKCFEDDGSVPKAMRTPSEDTPELVQITEESSIEPASALTSQTG